MIGKPFRIEDRAAVDLRTETSRPVRNGVVALVASVCKSEAEGEGDEAQAAAGWPELFQFMAGAAGDAHPEPRELAFLLLGEMTASNCMSMPFGMDTISWALMMAAWWAVVLTVMYQVTHQRTGVRAKENDGCPWWRMMVAGSSTIKST